MRIYFLPAHFFKAQTAFSSSLKKVIIFKATYAQANFAYSNDVH